jgi:hypothetical protein
MIFFRLFGPGVNTPCLLPLFCATVVALVGMGGGGSGSGGEGT